MCFNRKECEYYRMSQYEAQVDVKVNDSALVEAKQKLKELENKNITVKIAGDGKELSQILSTLKQISNAKPKIGVDTSGAKSAVSSLTSDFQKLKSLANEISRLKIQKANLELNPDKNVNQISVLSKQIDSLQNKYSGLYSTLKQDLNDTQITQLSSITEKTANKIEVLDAKAKDLSNTMKTTTSTFSSLDAKTASNRTLAWLESNTKAAKKYGQQLRELADAQAAATSKDELNTLNKTFRSITAEAQAEGLTGKSFYTETKRAFSQIFQFTQMYGGIQRIVSSIGNSINELKEVDSILTEISKTSDLTTAEINALGESAFDAASKWGKTASDYLLGIQEMSRSGYYGEQAEQMAQLSILTQAAGDLDADMANSYLLASNAAYQYAGNVQNLNTLLDGQNSITNRNSVSMQDMAEATTQAASMASELGVAEDQLSAMIGTIETRTKAGGNEVGNAIKSLLINVTNLNNAKIAGTFKKIGVAQTELVNGVEQMRNPIEILEDLAAVFNTLEESDPLRTEILTNIGQKYQANKLSSLLSGWSDYEKMLVDYSEGTGSAAIEAEKSANNWEGSLNKLSNAWTGFIQNFVDSDTIITATNALTGLINVVDKGSSTLGAIPTLLGILGGYQATKSGSGKLNYDKFHVIVINAPFYKIA